MFGYNERKKDYGCQKNESGIKKLNEVDIVLKKNIILFFLFFLV